MHQVSLVLIAIALLACAGCASAITLARDGASQYAIAIPADADAPTITAAEELQKTLKAVTGAAMEIAQEDGIATDARVIAVGPVSASERPARMSTSRPCNATAS